MGYYVAVQFSFSCNSLYRLKEVVSKTISDAYTFCERAKEEDVGGGKPSMEDFDLSYTKRMLEQVAASTDKYIHYGNKGDMFIWGGVWNYYSPEEEIYFLKEFLIRCWAYCNNEESIIFDFDRALLIVNREQSELSNLYEFSYAEGKVNVRQSESDLQWNQY